MSYDYAAQDGTPYGKLAVGQRFQLQGLWAQLRETVPTEDPEQVVIRYTITSGPVAGRGRYKKVVTAAHRTIAS